MTERLADEDYFGPLTRVECPWCGWRSNRRAVLCECDWVCHHTLYGTCPKCGGGVYSAEYVRDSGLRSERRRRAALASA